MVPVVGTVKNSAEALLALADDDMQLAKEKTVKATIGGVIDVATFGAGGIVVKGAKGLVVEGVEKGVENVGAAMIANKLSKDVAGFVCQNSGRFRTTITASELAELRQELKEPEVMETTENERSKRGEHVINNNVLKFFRAIIKSFVRKVMPGQSFESLVSSGRITPDMRVYQAYNNPLIPSYTNAIRYELVAKVDEAYVDANSVIYGERIEQLRGAVFTYMLAIYEDSNSSLPKMERHIIEMVEEFIAANYYTDQLALSIWLTQGGTMVRYEDVRREVNQMFRRVTYHAGNDEVIQWVNKLKSALWSGTY